MGFFFTGISIGFPKKFRLGVPESVKLLSRLPPRKPAVSIGFSGDEHIDLESLRARLRKMSDSELLRFGRAARSMCDPKTNLGQPPRQVFVIQLNEARVEWKRRFQK